MQDTATATPGRGKRIGISVALVGAGLAAGIVGATAIGANAAPSPSSSATSSYGSGHDGEHHGSKSMRDDEKSLGAATTAKLKAAAVKAVPGGTVNRVESDSGDATYEAHMTKTDGTEVTVKFGKNLAVTGVESGMGK